MKYLSVALLFVVSSCNQKSNNDLIDKVNQIEATLIEVELADKHTLFILLTKDGTINRKGDLKNSDKNFFMGISKEGLFDSLIQALTSDLASYCGKVYGLADTTQKVNKVTVAFSGKEIDTGLEYYSTEPLDKFPKPITGFIYKAIQITDPWFERQKKMIQAK
jgi:hypothetical protein